MSVETAHDGEAEQIAGDLGEVIADLPEYRAFIEAKRAVESSEPAQERIREFERRREAFVVARRTGDATSEDLESLQEAQESLHEVPVMSEFLQAQADLERTLQAINEAISAPLELDFGEKTSQCCAE